MSDSKRRTTRSAEIRERVGHPIIDSDGHVVEFVCRPFPGLAKQAHEFARHMTWMDNLCLDVILCGNWMWY